MEPGNDVLDYGAHVALLRELYPQGKVVSMHPNLIWICDLKPSFLSKTYTIRVEYKLNAQPIITVIKTKLSRGGADKLPHVWSDSLQFLCLHFPQEGKWTAKDNIADTIIPWASEWLFHYELWEISGNWSGGGTVH